MRWKPIALTGTIELMNGIPIHSLDDERISVYRDLTKSKLTRRSGRFIAEARFVVRRLLESDCKIESLLVSEHALHAVEDWLPDDVPTYVMPRLLVEELIGFKFHQGLLACGFRKPPARLDDLIRNQQTGLLVAIPHVCDPENVGQLIRTAAAFGADGVLLGPGCADPFSRRVIRVSMGNAFALPIVESADLVAELREYRKATGCRMVAAVLDDQAQALESIARPEKLCLLLGNEGDGLDDEWLELADVKATIPMGRGVDSLNVAVAAGIFLFHFSRGTGEHENG